MAAGVLKFTKPLKLVLSQLLCGLSSLFLFCRSGHRKASGVNHMVKLQEPERVRARILTLITGLAVQSSLPTSFQPALTSGDRPGGQRRRVISVTRCLRASTLPIQWGSVVRVVIRPSIRHVATMSVILTEVQEGSLWAQLETVPEQRAALFTGSGPRHRSSCFYSCNALWWAEVAPRPESLLSGGRSLSAQGGHSQPLLVGYNNPHT